jgi:autotransporter-associated beta strand protein
LDQLTGTGTVDLRNGSRLTISISAGTESFDGTLAQTSTSPGGDGSLIKNGSGTLELDGVTKYTGPTTINQGTLIFGPTSTMGATVVTVGSGSNAATLDFSAGSSGITTRTLAGLELAGDGSVNVSAASSNANRTLLVTPFVSFIPSGIASQGYLNLLNNDLIVQGGALSNVNAQVKQGFSNGAWNGSGGINSLSAAADTKHLTALGVIQNNQSGSVLFTSSNEFDGYTPAAADILVKYTYYGDANLDGKVDGSDYSRIDNGYRNHLTGWYNGDFNYDGVVDASDYTLIDNAFNQQGASLTDAVETTAEIAPYGVAAVPEPMSLTLAGIGCLALLRRHRRQPQSPRGVGAIRLG